MEPGSYWFVSLWWKANDVPHCRLLSSVEVKWRLVATTLCWRWSCCLADQLWLLMHHKKKKKRSWTNVWHIWANKNRNAGGSSFVDFPKNRCYSTVCIRPMCLTKLESPIHESWKLRERLKGCGVPLNTWLWNLQSTRQGHSVKINRLSTWSVCTLHMQ